MRTTAVLHLLAAALACAMVPAFGAETASPRPAAAPTRARHPRRSSIAAPRMPYRRRTLANGLAVYSIENHNSPTVAIQVWYKVGGKNDPEKRSGFAHLFEHLMFKATRNMKSEMLDRLTEDVGGENNAYTTEDRTVYHETVPSNYLETLLWAEAERMANLNVDAGAFASERAVVEEEYRQSVLAPPYGRLAELVNRRSFVAHPYRNGVIGSIADLDSAGIEDVLRFHRTFYRPDNAMLIVAGDFEPAKLDLWVEKVFGRIGSPVETPPGLTTQEPPRTQERRYSETGPNVPLPAVVVNYLVPPASSDDAAPLRVAGALLSSGTSARLYQSLVYKQRLASSASASADLRADAGLFQITTIAAGGKTIDAAEKAALAEIDRLLSEPVSAAEMSKARSQLLASTLRRRETASGQAASLGEVIALYGDAERRKPVRQPTEEPTPQEYHRAAQQAYLARAGDPERVNTDIRRIGAVTAEDVQRVARKYFIASNRVVVRYSAGGGEQGGASSVTSMPANPVAAPSKPVDTPPSPGAPRNASFPKQTEQTLANGLRVIVASRRGTGIVNIVTAIKAGASEDPANAAGLAEFTAGLLTRGTRARTATQVAESVEEQGGFISASAGWDSSTVSLSVLASHLEAALPAYADVIRNPQFAQEEIDRLRSQSADRLTVSLRSPSFLAQGAAARLVFGEGPYGHPSGGTPESIKSLTAPSIEQFYRTHYLPQRAVVVFSGDITPAAAYRLASQYFGDWKAAAAATPPETVPMPAGQNGRVVVIDKPDAGQAAVVLARPAIRRSDPEYMAARVANSILGEGFSSRINQEIRIKRGLSYGARSRIDARRYAGLFEASAQTRNDAVPEVARLLMRELTRLASDTVPEAELMTRKAHLSGSYSRDLETGRGLAAAIADLATHDLPLSTLSAYLTGIQSVKPSDVQTFAKRQMDPTPSCLVIVGDGRQFLAELRKQFPDVEVIPVSELDLNSASLRKDSDH